MSLCGYRLTYTRMSLHCSGTMDNPDVCGHKYQPCVYMGIGKHVQSLCIYVHIEKGLMLMSIYISILDSLIFYVHIETSLIGGSRSN